MKEIAQRGNSAATSIVRETESRHSKERKSATTDDSVCNGSPSARAAMLIGAKQTQINGNESTQCSVFQSVSHSCIVAVPSLC